MVTKIPRPGAVQAAKTTAVKPPTCKHIHAIPIECRFGIVGSSDPGVKPFQKHLDWSGVSFMSAQRIRVTRLYCPECGEEISIPLRRTYYE